MLLWRTPRHRRRGTILVYFALLVFALFTMAALVIDLGLVRTTQQQMQSGAETTALEGLRWRDQLPDITGLDLTGAPDQTSNPTGYRDWVRRAAAKQLNGWQYDADLNLDTTDTQYGAGPVVTFTGGKTNAKALQSVSGTSVYKPYPNLQLNAEDNQAGDLVAGTFISGMNPTEASDYSRNDFTPSSSGTGATASAFLARLRRTQNLQGLDNQAGISSMGSPVQLLFGRAAQFSGISPPRAGITVRAAAIASSFPAKTVGPGRPDLGLPGTTPFGLTQTTWKGLGITQLADVIQPGDTTLTVQDGSSFPAVPFAVIIDSETILVTAVGGTMSTSWTVQRGWQGGLDSTTTTATQHQQAAQVFLYPYGYNVDPQGKITQAVGLGLQTTLAAPASLMDTMLTVSSATGPLFPPVPFSALLDPNLTSEEIILVTAVDPTKTIWTVQRGALGTTAVSHLVSAMVQLYLGTALTADVKAADTTITVITGSTFPAVPFAILIETEILSVTAIDATNAPASYSLSVQRGALNTTPAPHSMSTQVQLYAGQMLQITNLSAAVKASDTSIAVSSSYGFPSALPFTVRIQDTQTTELLTVTAVNGLTWTVQRQVQNTQADQNGYPINTPVFLQAPLALGRRIDNLPAFVSIVDISSTQPTSLDTGTLSTSSLMPVFDTIPQDTNTNQQLIVGFGQVTRNQVLAWNPSMNQCRITLTQQTGSLIPKNASAAYSVPTNFFNDPQSNQPLASTVLGSMLSSLFQSHNSLSNSILVPALAR